MDLIKNKKANEELAGLLPETATASLVRTGHAALSVGVWPFYLGLFAIVATGSGALAPLRQRPSAGIVATIPARGAGCAVGGSSLLRRQTRPGAAPAAVVRAPGKRARAAAAGPLRAVGAATNGAVSTAAPPCKRQPGRSRCHRPAPQRPINGESFPRPPPPMNPKSPEDCAFWALDACATRCSGVDRASNANNTNAGPVPAPAQPVPVPGCYCSRTSGRTSRRRPSALQPRPSPPRPLLLPPRSLQWSPRSHLLPRPGTPERLLRSARESHE